MFTKLNNRSDLMLYAKEALTNPELDCPFIEHLWYDASDDRSTPSGLLKGMIIPCNNQNRSFFSYELYTCEGQILYGICVYDHKTESIYFTGWYNVCSVVIDEFQNSLGSDT